MTGLFGAQSYSSWITSVLTVSSKLRDCHPDPVFSISGFGIGESLIPGSRREYRYSKIRDSSVLNCGIKKTGTLDLDLDNSRQQRLSQRRVTGYL